MKIFFTYLSVLSLLISILFFTPEVWAHVLKTDGNIGAVLHIDPDDDPIAGQVASFFFEFKDKQNKFQPQNCDCTFSITEEGKEIYTQPLFQNNPSPSLTNSSVFYTFPQKDVYQIKVVGNPNNLGDFQSFTLVYDVRVDRIASSQNSQTTNNDSNWLASHILLVLGGFIVGAVIIFFVIKQVVSEDDKEMIKKE